MFITSLFVCVGPEKPRLGVANVYIYIYIYYKVINFSALPIFTLGVVCKNARVESIYSNQIIWSVSKADFDLDQLKINFKAPAKC